MQQHALTSEEDQLIDVIAARAWEHKDIRQAYRNRKITLHLDLANCHARLVPLRLADMAKAENFAEVLHDIVGIASHLERDTGKLRQPFHPRFAREA